MAWAFAMIGCYNNDLMEAISTSALDRLGEKSNAQPHDLAGLAWSFAHLTVHNDLLYDAIAAAAAVTKGGSGGGRWAMGDAAALAWALRQAGKLPEPSPSWAQGAWPCEMDMGWSRRSSGSERNTEEERGQRWYGAPRQAQKLNELQAAIEEALQGSEWPVDPSLVLRAITDFGATRGQWLKVAAGAKAEVVDAALKRRPFRPGEVVLELGCFVGFSALRMASVLQEQSRRVPVVTIEKDTGCASLADMVLDSAGMATRAEVWRGRSSDILPRVLEEYGKHCIGFAFFDHSGTVYHEDLEQMERLELLAPDAVVVADNVLKPGAPIFLWHLKGPGWSGNPSFSLHEFAQPMVEDWVALGQRISQAAEVSAREIPEEFLLLSWEADRMRRLSELGGATLQDWTAFAQRMKVVLRKHGLTAEPWETSSLIP